MNNPGSTLQDSSSDPALDLSQTTVTLCSAIRTNYLSYLFAGCAELRQQGLNVRFGDDLPHPVAPALAWYMAWAKLEHPSLDRPCWLMFDLFDYPEFPDDALVEHADVYFKRSYLNERAQAYPTNVVPMTMQYGCRSETETLGLAFRRAWGGGHPSRGALSRVAGVAAELFGQAGRRLTGTRDRPPFMRELVVDPDEPAEAAVYFRTRLYDPDQAPNDEAAEHLAALNEQRTSIITALRAEFGERCFAGLYGTAASARLRPDLLLPLPDGLDGHSGHLVMSHRFLVNVNAHGVRHSTGWKLPESIAASRCIVSPTPPYTNLTPVRTETHYLAFDDSTQLVEQCQTLLADPDLAHAMRHSNAEYYRKHLAPGAALAENLTAALRRQSA